MGALVGDALGLGPHWYYDLEEMRRDFGPWIDGYTTPKEGRYHSGMSAGDLSQTGLIIRMLLESTVTCDGYDGLDFRERLDRELLPKLDGQAESGPGGFTNHSFRQLWQARVHEGRPWDEVGGNADTSEAAERCCVIAARHAVDPAAVAWHSFDCTRLAQTDSLIVQQSVGFSLVLAALVRGEPFDEELSGKLMDQVGDGTVRFTAESSVMEDEGAGPSLGFASPDALLLPSWMARTAHDPDLLIEPAWKISIVHGMSCALPYVLPAAYYLAARFPDDFENAVLHAINGGGQNMSRACLTGALVGAQTGLSGIPRRFIDGLKDGASLEQGCLRLADLAVADPRPPRQGPDRWPAAVGPLP
ncbi:ADP-ribosylglycohydrolase family protein [Haloferula sargassicola]|uniref:ADP-ribosylglycohydrolase n=1 Tax=Haloferula sargassicola TaxID=490096 RepID=A0ABP9UWB1_9BACT